MFGPSNLTHIHHMHPTHAPARPHTTPISTPTVLLDTAEKLFAQKGIDSVSIRQIVIASGHGNLSGARYHFGTREALIRKLLERRMVVVNALRHQALDALVVKALDQDLVHIIGSTVHVLETVVRDYPWGADYVRITAQALLNPDIRLLASIDTNAVSGLSRTAAMARRVLPYLPLPVFEERMRMVRFTTVAEFARWFQENFALTPQTQANFEAMINNTAAFVTAGLVAPLAPTLHTPTAQ